MKDNLEKNLVVPTHITKIKVDIPNRMLGIVDIHLSNSGGVLYVTNY